MRVYTACRNKGSTWLLGMCFLLLVLLSACSSLQGSGTSGSGNTASSSVANQPLLHVGLVQAVSPTQIDLQVSGQPMLFTLTGSTVYQTATGEPTVYAAVQVGQSVEISNDAPAPGQTPVAMIVKIQPSPSKMHW